MNVLKWKRHIMNTDHVGGVMVLFFVLTVAANMQLFHLLSAFEALDQAPALPGIFDKLSYKLVYGHGFYLLFFNAFATSKIEENLWPINTLNSLRNPDRPLLLCVI